MDRMTSTARSRPARAEGHWTGRAAEVEARQASRADAVPARLAVAGMASPARVRQARHPGLAVLTGVVAASAYVGAIGMITGFLTLGTVVTSRLPLASPVLGGVALLAVVAIPATVTSWLAASGDRRAGDASVLAGVLLAGWIIVELAFIRQLSFFHPLYLLVGGLLIWLGFRARRPREPSHARP